MKESIFSKHLYFIITICILSSILYLWYCLNQIEVKEDFFIPEFPSMSEYYVQKIKEIKKHKIKYYMTIPYGDNLVSKNNLWNMVRDCKISKKYLPKSFILENFYDELELKKTFSKDKIYILKKNIHRKTGLKLFKGELYDLKKEYTNGGYKVIQEFIKNPFLINQRILVVRLYLLIQREDDIYNFHLHKYGKCLYTSENFSLENLNVKKMITDNKTLLDDTFPQSLDELRDYGIDINLLKEPINNVLKCFKNFISKIDDKPYHEQLKFFQLFGVDIILNNNMSPFVLEINKNPNMESIYHEKERMMKKQVIDDVKDLVKTNNDKNFIKM